MTRFARRHPFDAPLPVRAAPCPACLRLRLQALVAVVTLSFGIAGPTPHAAGNAALPAAVSAVAASATSGVAASLAPVTAGAASAVARAAALPASVAASVAASISAAVAAARGASAAASAPGPAASAVQPAPAASGAASGTAALTLPVAPPTPASATPLATCAGAAASAPECRATTAPALQWLFTAVPLPPARRDEAYGPRRLVEGGQGAYTFTLLVGRLPPGLAISADGVLGGVPTLVGVFPFTLLVRDASTPAQSTQQGYTMRVLAPRAPAAAKPPVAASAVPATLTRVTNDDANRLVSEAQSTSIKSWQFSAADLDALAPPAAAASAAAGAASAAAVEPGPTPAGPPPSSDPVPLADQLRELLAPLVDVEYPTRELFESSLAHAHCRYFRALTTAAARKQGIADTPVECPPKPPPRAPGRPASGAAADSITLEQLYTQLLPADYRSEVIRIAEKSHVIADAKPTQWFGDALPATWLGSDCGCAPAAALGETYAFYPFWLANGKPQPMDFGLFRRIGYLGAVPDDAGGYVTPPDWSSSQTGFTRTAQRHGTEVDLVLYRRDWSTLLRQPASQQQLIAQQAATNAVALADTKPEGAGSRLNGLLLPFWHEPSRLYSGLTVFFDDTSTSPADREAFRNLYRAFMRQLIAEMQQRSGRTYALNIVVPEQRLGENGTFGFGDLIEYLELAEPASPDAASTAANQADYKTGTQIELRFIVPLAEPTSEHKKALRERLDRSEFVKGHRRNEFLKSLVPVLFYPGAGEATRLAPEAAARLDADLQYFWWNFGNVAFWTPPMRDAGPGGEVGNVLAHAFALRGDGALEGLCRFVCPNRVPLRLLFQSLVLIGALSIGLYIAVCRVRSLGRPYLVFLLVGGGITLLVAAALLSCDPALDSVRAGNSLFYAVIVALFAAGAYALLRPRVDKP